MDLKPSFLSDLSKKQVLIGLAVLFLIYFIFFHHKSGNQFEIKPPVVIVEQPKLEKMADYVSQTGNTAAYNSVDLVARVEGYLTKVLFTDGTFVKKDSPLFVIEPQPYQEKLTEAQATVSSQEASLAYTQAEYKRQQRMYKENATSLNNVEKWLAKYDQAKANIAQAKANAVIAEINYSYTHIAAPFNGRIGRHLVDPGNLVGNGEATKLANIEQVDPIYVYFNLNELDLIKLRTAARAQGFKPQDLKKIPAYVEMQNETGYPHKGHLDFVDTGLNASTGTMEFRAVLPNKDFTLVPGLFVRVRIPISNPAPYLTVPDAAIQYDQIGPYLYLTDKNNQVVLQRVSLGAVENGRRAITKGLRAEDKVIVNGLQNATPGHPVNPKTAAQGA